MNKFTIEIVNYFDKDEVIAEIYYEHVQWAEISVKNQELIIQFHSSKNHWEFHYEEVIKVLEQAKNKLLIKKDSFFSKIFLMPEQINEQAQKILEEILNHPDRKIIPGEFKRFGKVIDIYVLDIGGARYSIEGEFIGFLEL